jgi:hypothetical protein
VKAVVPQFTALIARAFADNSIGPGREFWHTVSHYLDTHFDDRCKTMPLLLMTCYL